MSDYEMKVFWPHKSAQSANASLRLRTEHGESWVCDGRPEVANDAIFRKDVAAILTFLYSLTAQGDRANK